MEGSTDDEKILAQKHVKVDHVVAISLKKEKQVSDDIHLLSSFPIPTIIGIC
jgi:hypothetical protein